MSDSWKCRELEKCAIENRCWRYKEPDECNCSPGRMHTGGCSNVNAIGRVCPGKWCNENGYAP